MNTEALDKKIIEAIRAIEYRRGASMQDIEDSVPRTCSRLEIRASIWRLMEEGVLDFTPSWRITIR